MRSVLLPALFITSVLAAGEPTKPQPGLLAVPFHEVEVKDAFWSPRLKTTSPR